MEWRFFALFAKKYYSSLDRLDSRNAAILKATPKITVAGATTTCLAFFVFKNIVKKIINIEGITNGNAFIIISFNVWGIFSFFAFFDKNPI